MIPQEKRGVPRPVGRLLKPAFLALMALSAAIHGQPRLLIGKADAEISGAFAYDILKSPLSRPLDKGQARAGINLPINVSAQFQRTLGEMADSNVVIPEFFGRVSQNVNAHIDLTGPLFGGVAFFAARENASLNVSGALGNTSFDLDTVMETGTVLLKGSVHMPLVFDMRWRSLTFGYASRPAPGFEIAFQVHKHLFSARTSGDLRPDLSGRISVSGEQANTSFLVEYPDTKVYGRALGSYAGKAWSPEMAVRLGPVRVVSRMGARIAARGSLDVAYSVPFFINPEDFKPRFTSPDSFLAAENMRKLLDGETGKKEIHIADRLIVTLPQSHTVEWAALGERLTLSYTRVLGNLSIHWESYGDTADTNRTEMAGYADLDVYPDHVLCVSTDWGWFRGNAGLLALNLSYHAEKNLLTGLSGLEWDGDPLVPILNLGFSWGDPVVFSLDVHVSPLPAIRSGVTYGF